MGFYMMLLLIGMSFALIFTLFGYTGVIIWYFLLLVACWRALRSV